MFKAIPYLFFAFLLAGCLTTEQKNSQILETWQQRMNAVLPNGHHVPYLKDVAVPLSHFQFLDEKSLIEEATFIDFENYSVGLKILAEWSVPRSSVRKNIQFQKLCSEVVGGDLKEFVMTESNLPCAGWWLDKIMSSSQSDVSASKKKIDLSDFKEWDILGNKENWDKLKKLIYPEISFLIRQFDEKSMKKAFELANQVKKDCGFSKAFSAILSYAEVFLPAEEIYSEMKKLYLNTENCFLIDEIYSTAHMRMGLLFAIKGENELAKEAFLKVLKDNAYEEKFRALFWLGYLEKTSSPKAWHELAEHFPLTIHAILAKTQMNEDPFAELLQGPDPIVERREDVKAWTPANVKTFVLELLMASNNIESAKFWEKRFNRDLAKSTQGYLLFWANVANKLENYKNSIFLSNRYFSRLPSKKINESFFRLLFPTYLAEKIIVKSSKIDPIFVLSLVKQESAFDSQARSVANARGLMQLLPSTAREFKNISSQDLYRPDMNLSIGVMYLEKLLDSYQGQAEFVLAAYNAGTRNLEKWRRRTLQATPYLLFLDYIPFRETRNYIAVILRNRYWYKRNFQSQTDSLSKTILEKSEVAKWKIKDVYELLNSPYVFKDSLIISEKIP